MSFPLIPYKISSSWGNSFWIVRGADDPSLVTGVDTKRLGKGRVNDTRKRLGIKGRANMEEPI